MMPSFVFPCHKNLTRLLTSSNSIWFKFAALAILILLSAYLRFAHYDFGLPNQYHYDERGATMQIQRLARGDYMIKSYNHPPLLRLLGFLIVKPFINSVSPVKSEQNIFINKTLRLISVFFGSISTIALFFLARMFLPFGYSYFCSFLYTILPLTVINSKYGTPDVMLMFFYTASVFGILKSVLTKSITSYFFTGICVSLAIGSKYNAILLYIAFAVGHFISIKENKANSIKNLLFNKQITFFALANIIGFLISFHFIFFGDFKNFISSITYEKNHLLKNGDFGIKVSGMDYLYVYYFIKAIFPASGVPLSILIISGLIFLIYNAIKYKKISYVILLSVVAPYYISMENLYKIHPNPERYVLPLVPVYLLSATIFLRFLIDHIVKKISIYRKPILYLIIMLTAIFPCLKTYNYLKTLVPDTRDIMLLWMEKNIPHGSKIVIHWAFSGYYPYIGGNFKLYNLHKWDYDYIKSVNADYIMASSMDYERFINNPHDVPEITNLFESIFKNHVLVHEVKNRYGAYMNNNPTIKLYKLNNTRIENNG